MIETDGRQYVIKLSNGTFTNAFTAPLAHVLDNLKPDEAYTYGVFLDIARGVDEKSLLYQVIPAILNGELKLNILFSGWESYLKAKWKKKLGKKKFETLVYFINWKKMAEEAEKHSCLIPEAETVFKTEYGMLEIPARLKHLL